jgi:lipopolysaccharide export system permease protein
VAVFGGILQRMILRELAKVFLVSLVAITGILLLAGIVAEASQQGLGPGQILAAIPLLIPSTLPYTIPATTLFAACVVYGRMAADNEILAIKSAGINLFKVVRPGLVLGLVMSATTVALYYHVIPYSHHLLRAMVFNDAEELLYSILRKHGFINHSQMPYSMIVKGVQGRKLLFPTFRRRDAQGRTDVVAVAREADLRVVMAKKQVLLHMRYGTAQLQDGSIVEFVDRTWDVDLPSNFGAESTRRARDMTWREILRKREELRQSLTVRRAEVAAATDLSPEARQHLINQANAVRQQLQLLDVELLMRPALSVGCLCFILVGCPVGIWFSRQDYLSSFITCFLPIVVIYYPLMLCGTGMARDGRYNPVLMVWGANLVVGAVGLGLFVKLLRN